MNPIVEAFRGLAAIMVLTHHYSYKWPGQVDGTEWLHGFHNGVDLFFVITGYVFAPHVLREVRDSIFAFAVRRFWRLYPLYIVSLLGYSFFIVDNRSDIYLNFFRHLFFMQNFAGLAEAGYFSLVYWTLPVEVSYYFVLAILMLVPINGGISTRIVAIEGILLSALAYFWHAWGYAPKSESWVILQGQLPPLLIEFWLGVVVYRVSPLVKSRYVTSWFITLFGAGLLALLFASYNVFSQVAMSPRPFGLFNFLSAVAYALLLAGTIGLFSNSKNTTHLEKKLYGIGIFCGSLSYGIYLFHELILLLIQKYISGPPPFIVVMALTATFVTAFIFHKILENPCRALGRRLAQGVPKYASIG